MAGIGAQEIKNIFKEAAEKHTAKILHNGSSALFSSQKQLPNSANKSREVDTRLLASESQESNSAANLFKDRGETISQ